MDCSNGHPNAEEQRYCGTCGEPLTVDEATAAAPFQWARSPCTPKRWAR